MPLGKTRFNNLTKFFYAIQRPILLSTLYFSSDGMCLHESKFCDGQMDCIDKTDELFCNLVRHFSLYFSSSNLTVMVLSQSV